jgi:hypothetical protein
VAVVSLADTQLARLLSLLLSGLVFEGSSRVRLVSGSHRCYCRLLSRDAMLRKDVGPDVGVGVGRLRVVCGGARGESEWLRGGLS